MPSNHRKILNRQELKQAVTDAHDAGRLVVHCHGCFDIVHPGHLQYLKFARSQGDLLLVSVTGDSQITKHELGPYVPQELRAETLAALEIVNLIYIDESPTAVSLIRDVQPDVFVKGKEYETNGHEGFAEERQAIESYGGRVIFSSGDVVFSSTELLRSMPRSKELESHRMMHVCRRHGITADRLMSIVEGFSSRRVLVIGDILLDRYVYCDALNAANEAPMMSLSKLGEKTYPGGAAIIARHLREMGAHPILISSGANDEATHTIAETLIEAEIPTHLVPCRQTTVEKTRYLVEHHKLIKIETAKTQPLDSISEKRVAELIEHQTGLLDAVIFADFGYGMITKGLLDRVLANLRERTKILSGDVSGQRGNLLQYQNFDMLCPTEREMRSAIHDFDEGLSSVAWKLLRETQAKHLFVTLGKQGVVSFERQTSNPDLPEWSGRLRSEHLPAFSDHALDTLGCGDAFLSTATLALACGSNAMQAAYLGNVAAAHEVTQIGNIPVPQEWVLRWLAHRSELQIEDVENFEYPGLGTQPAPLRIAPAAAF